MPLMCSGEELAIASVANKECDCKQFLLYIVCRILGAFKSSFFVHSVQDINELD